MSVDFSLDSYLDELETAPLVDLASIESAWVAQYSTIGVPSMSSMTR